jgi:PAS domain S-box-containing protein
VWPSTDAGFRAVIESSPDGIVIHHGGVIVYANAAIAQMLDFESPEAMHGLPVIGRVHPDDRPQTLERIRRLNAGEMKVPFVEARLLHRDNVTVSHCSVIGIRLEFQGEPFVVAVCRDVTEQRRLHTRLVEAERMVALGTLSAGIAHEINNPLTYLSLHLEAVTNMVERLRPMVDGDAIEIVERLDASLAVAQDGAMRVRDIVRDLGVFARISDDERTWVDVAAVVRRAVTMTAHELRQRAQVVVELGDMQPVRGGEGRLTQVFVNLLINAAHAVGTGDAEHQRVTIRGWSDDAKVYVSIADTGHGIAPELLPRIFEPFFTTKPVGEGSGLGLAIVHGIVTGLGGTIDVTSAPGAGATFLVSLPIPDARR